MTAETHNRVVLHVDMDAFYASIEQRDNPDLAGKPVIVGGTSNRGVVAAASYEVRAFGVRSAMPVREALRRCPDAICVRPRIAHYRDVSRVVFGVFREFTPDIEGLSLDEAFLDVGESLALFGSPGDLALRIKTRILEETGLTASVGGGPNKLVAKIASDLDKPDGLRIVTPEDVIATLDPLPAARIPGVGPKTRASLKAAGIATIGDLRTTPIARLRPIFGRYAERMRDRASGIDHRPVVAYAEDKSISTEETFDTDLHDGEAMIGVLRQQAEKVAERVRRKNLSAGVVRVKIRTADFRTRSRQRALQPPSNDTRVVGEVAQALFEAWLQANPGSRVRLLGVGCGQLIEMQQYSLFDSNDDGTVDKAVDDIRERFGADSLKRGSRLR